MNYYERHLGDYAKDTAHLSVLEHGVYTLLLDRYYATEEGIPADQAHRVARARSQDERAAVDAVLAEFFSLVDGLWTHARVERELLKAKARIDAAKNNGKLGGRPKKNQEETQRVSGGLANQNPDATQTKAHHTPNTNTSVAKATGAAAPSPADTIFALGLPLLMASGVPEKNCRSMLGLMRKTHGDSAVIDALSRCAEAEPLQPVAWLQQVLKAPISKPDRVAHSNIAVVRQFAERKTSG